MIVSCDDADDAGHCQGTACGGPYVRFFNRLLELSLQKPESTGTGILAIGVNGGNALIALNTWKDVANGGSGAAVTFANTTTDIASANFADFAMIFLPSDENNTSGGMTQAQLDALNARQADIVNYVNHLGGSLLALTEAALGCSAWGWLPLVLEIENRTKDPRRNNLTVFLVVILSAAKDLPCNYREILRCAQNDSRAK